MTRKRLLHSTKEGLHDRGTFCHTKQAGGESPEGTSKRKASNGVTTGTIPERDHGWVEPMNSNLNDLRTIREIEDAFLSIGYKHDLIHKGLSLYGFHLQETDLENDLDGGFWARTHGLPLCVFWR